MLIRNFPVAQALHMRSCQDLDTEQLRDILVQEDDFLGQGLLRVKEAYNSSVSSLFSDLASDQLLSHGNQGMKCRLTHTLFL